MKIKAKMAISFLLARSLSLIARTNRLQGNARTKEILSGEAQQSSRNNQWVNPAPFDWRTLPERTELGMHKFVLNSKCFFKIFRLTKLLNKLVDRCDIFSGLILQFFDQLRPARRT